MLIKINSTNYNFNIETDKTTTHLDYLLGSLFFQARIKINHQSYRGCSLGSAVSAFYLDARVSCLSLCSRGFLASFLILSEI